MATQRELEIRLVEEAQKRGMSPDKIKEVVVAYRAQSGTQGQVAPAAAPTPAQSFSERQDAKHPILATGAKAVTGLAKAIATPFTRTAGTIAGAAMGLGSKPEDEQAIENMGMFKPYGTKREAVGGALQIGATLLPGAKEVKGLLAASAAAKVPQAVSQSFVGGATGLGYGAGTGLEKAGRERKDFLGTVGDVAMGAAGGGTAGLAIGAVTGKATDWWNKPRPVAPAPKEGLLKPKEGRNIYRGGNELDEAKVSDSGISFSSSKDVADDFAKHRGGSSGEYQLSPGAKIAKYSDYPEAKYKNADPDRLLDSIRRNPDFIEDDFTKAAKWAKSNGYDAIELPVEGEIRVVNNSAVKKTGLLLAQDKKPGMAEIVSDKARKAGEFAKAAPGRIAVNAKEAADDAAFMAKQSPEVRKAITNGVTTRDARITAGLDTNTKKIAREMIDQADLIARGDDGVNPADIAGREFQKRIDLAESVRQDVGERLGETVKGLKGEVVRSRHEVLSELQKVDGLRGIKIDNRGNLNFNGTAMSSSARSSERKAINALWNDIRGRDAFSLHQLRQEIFDILGGKTRSATPPTEIEEKALEAIRKGLSNSLDQVDNNYKVLNKEYAKIIEPLKTLRKFYRGLEGASDDILNEQSGNFMSRLSGKSKSGGQLMVSIGQLDDELAKRGIKSGVDLRKLNDFNDILQNYYLETVKAGGFAGQTALGIKKGLMGKLDAVVGEGIDTVVGSVSQTDAVKRAALRSLLGL